VIRERAPKARDFTNRRYRQRGVVNDAEKARNPHRDRSAALLQGVFGFKKWMAALLGASGAAKTIAARQNGGRPRRVA
jgi:hypothetical protein